MLLNKSREIYIYIYAFKDSLPKYFFYPKSAYHLVDMDPCFKIEWPDIFSFPLSS